MFKIVPWPQGLLLGISSVKTPKGDMSYVGSGLVPRDEIGSMCYYIFPTSKFLERNDCHGWLSAYLLQWPGNRNYSKRVCGNRIRGDPSPELRT